MFATTATGAVRDRPRSSRRGDVIGQAKGMLMERFGLGAEQAFASLVQPSQEANLRT